MLWMSMRYPQYVCVLCVCGIMYVVHASMFVDVYTCIACVSQFQHWVSFLTHFPSYILWDRVPSLNLKLTCSPDWILNLKDPPASMFLHAKAEITGSCHHAVFLTFVLGRTELRSLCLHWNHFTPWSITLTLKHFK